MRITVHPGQWTQLASPREVVVENAILELEYQCEMLDAMGIGTEGVMVIHMVRSVASSPGGLLSTRLTSPFSLSAMQGGVYGDKESTLERFKTNYKTLVPDKVKQRLVLENDEVNPSPQSCRRTFGPDSSTYSFRSATTSMTCYPFAGSSKFLSSLCVPLVQSCRHCVLADVSLNRSI